MFTIQELSEFLLNNDANFELIKHEVLIPILPLNNVIFSFN